MSMIGKISRNPNECEEQYLWRLGQAKDNGIVDCGWDDIADEIRNSRINYQLIINAVL